MLSRKFLLPYMICNCESPANDHNSPEIVPGNCEYRRSDFSSHLTTSSNLINKKSPADLAYCGTNGAIFSKFDSPVQAIYVENLLLFSFLRYTLVFNHTVLDNEPYLEFSLCWNVLVVKTLTSYDLRKGQFGSLSPSLVIVLVPLSAASH